MANLSTLPKEILHEIISYVSPEPGLPAFADLLSCIVVCKSLSEIAHAALYCRIDLTREVDRDEDADEKTDRRQMRLLQTIAENPKLGSMVRVFKNNKNQSYGENGDVTTDSSTDVSLLLTAARNMKHLSKAFFMPNQLAAHVIANLPDYPQLVELSLYGFKPNEHIWGNASVVLRSLQWTFPVMTSWGLDHDPNAWDNVNFLINVAEATCPDLQSLDLSFSGMSGVLLGRASSVSSELVHNYAQTERSGPGKLAHLQSFAFRYRSAENHETQIADAFFEFVNRYAHTLTSITIPIPYGSWRRGTLDQVLRVCMVLPGLKSLSLANTNCGSAEPSMNPHAFFQELTTRLSSSTFSIERFSVLNIQCSFSLSLGRLFQSWQSLKFLQIGDGDMDEGPFGDDGRAQFNDYRPILGFIKALPPSLEELFMEINGPELICDENEDFDPIANMGPEIFGTLRRLRSCDIHAWISNIDGGLGQTPEKAVMHRRLPTPGDSKLNLDISNKVVWTSRMDDVYQEDDALVRVYKADVADFIGKPFEGRDADGVWLDGFTSERKRGGTRRGRSPDEPDYSWPFYVDKLGTYEGFRDRHD